MLEGLISPPANEADILRFLADVDNHVDTIEIAYRMSGYEEEVRRRGGTLLVQWSNLRHAGHDVAWRHRQERHKLIVEKLLPSKSKADNGTKPVVAIIVGPPGSGKTSVAVPAVKNKLGIEFCSVNPDDVKELLPEYEGWNAAALHEESSDLAERRIERAAVSRRHNIVYDITGRDAAKVRSAVDDFRAYGFRVFLILTALPAWKAAVRVWERFQSNPFGRDPSRDPGRYVPPRYVYEHVADHPSRTFETLKTHPAIEGYCAFNVDVPLGSAAPIIESKGW